jgi:pseudaminic acid synthase
VGWPKLVFAIPGGGFDLSRTIKHAASPATTPAAATYSHISPGLYTVGMARRALRRGQQTGVPFAAALAPLTSGGGRMHAFSSPFDDTAVDFLEELSVPCYKAFAALPGYASFTQSVTAVSRWHHLSAPVYRCSRRSAAHASLSYYPQVQCSHKPICQLLSNLTAASIGMASLGEIEEAISTLVAAGTPPDQICLLKCTSAYPCPPEESNLRTIPNLASTFSVPVGLSVGVT